MGWSDGCGVTFVGPPRRPRVKKVENAQKKKKAEEPKEELPKSEVEKEKPREDKTKKKVPSERFAKLELE